MSAYVISVRWILWVCLKTSSSVLSNLILTISHILKVNPTFWTEAISYHIISYHVMSNYLISSYHIIFTPHDISTVVGFVCNIGKHPSSDPHDGNISTTLCPDLCTSKQRRLKEGLFLLHQSISPYAGDTCWEPRPCRMSQVVGWRPTGWLFFILFWNLISDQSYDIYQL